jgi:hypothetical protein
VFKVNQECGPSPHHFFKKFRWPRSGQHLPLAHARIHQSQGWQQMLSAKIPDADGLAIFLQREIILGEIGDLPCFSRIASK